MNRRDLLKLSIALPAVAAPPPNWTPTFFTTDQYQTMNDLSDVIIPTTNTPGAKEALVARHLDKLLAASDPEFQNQITADLDTFDRFARLSAGDAFTNLTARGQRSTVEQFMVSSDSPAFDRLKAWTARMYYATEAGFRELNKGGRVPPTYGCQPA
jgi:gluconate 2-dehydrogenase gamma chain